MAVDNKHPDYDERISEWAMVRDVIRGPLAVKARRFDYLPMPSGFALQDDVGVAMYAAYSTRAQLPDIFNPTVQGMIGVIHRSEAEISMPDAMLPIWEKATNTGLPLEAFHRRITAELLEVGRYSILVDGPSNGTDLPYMVGYSAESLINWSETGDFFVLNESNRQRDEFDWKDFIRYRVLQIVDGQYQVKVYEGQGDAQNITIVNPKARANRPLTQIPIVVIGSRDLSITIDEPPMIGVARASLAIFRLDADYRHQLYMSGQETMVVINGKAPTVVGAGVILEINGQGADAKYVGPSGSGIAAHRTAIQDEREAAVASGAKMFDATKRAAESGEALRLRYAAQTATLTTVAMASAAGLEKALRHVAIRIGVNPEEVIVKPNLRFVDTIMTPEQAESMIRAWQSGGISYTTMYENLRRGQIASEERDAEEELQLIQSELPDLSHLTQNDNPDLKLQLDG